MKHTASMILNQRMEDEQQNAGLGVGLKGERSGKVTSGAGLPG